MNIERITTHLSKESGQGTAMLSRQGKATISNFLCFSREELNAKRIKFNKEAAELEEMQVALDQGIPVIMKELLRKTTRKRPSTNTPTVVRACLLRRKRELGHA